jgi:hypothetical protein
MKRRPLIYINDDADISQYYFESQINFCFIFASNIQTF